MATTPNPEPALAKTAPAKLQMLWPEGLASPPFLLPEGYALRTFRTSDAAGYIGLLHAAGFTYWTSEILERWLLKALPGGIFVIEHEASGDLAATAMASHNPDALHPFGGELGWVAGMPEHAGKGLGRAVCCAVVARFLTAGYGRIYLKTDDWRVPAIRIYLQMGFLPLLYTAEMRDRWIAVCDQAGIPGDPSTWLGLAGS